MTTLKFTKTNVVKGGGYVVWLDGRDIGYVMRNGASGRFGAMALIDQHAVTIPGFGTTRSGTLEGVRSSYHDGTFPSRASAAKALTREFRHRGIRKAAAS